MDSEENETVKERPAQLDVRYRPGTFGFTSKTLADSDHEAEKNPYEKMLEDETEKENKRRQALGLGFVLGTPNDESDGTILFNYDEPPAPAAEEEEYRNQSFAMESDSTLNNALRRAIREQQDQEMNKRFMEGGSSGSSLESIGSNCEVDERDLDVATALKDQQNKSEAVVSAFGSNKVENQSQNKELDTKSESSPEQRNQELLEEETRLGKTLLQQLQPPPPQSLQQPQPQPQPQSDPQTLDQLATTSLLLVNPPKLLKSQQPQINPTQCIMKKHSQTQTNQIQQQQNEQPKIQEVQLQSVHDIIVHLPSQNLQAVEDQNIQPQNSIENSLIVVSSNPSGTTKTTKKQSFFKRIFGKK